jgi:hypothetical protein
MTAVSPDRIDHGAVIELREEDLPNAKAGARSVGGRLYFGDDYTSVTIILP